jgi:ubiquinone/menaquinone biosynthesis C-methylase UbiE
MEVDTMTETFQISPEQAEAYEQLFVPAIFAQWTAPMLDLAGVAPGQRVLDVACGTGVLARAAAQQVDEQSVVGLDLNPAMLEVAARIQPGISWRQGDAGALPFGDEEFDAVLCQSALFFFPDVPAALAEMARVARPGGVVAVQTYAKLEDQPSYRDLMAVVVQQAGADAQSLVETYFSQGDLPALCRTLERVGLRVDETRTMFGAAEYGSVEQFVETEVKGTPLADRLTDAQIELILREAADILGRFEEPDGHLAVPIRAHLAAARRTG